MIETLTSIILSLCVNGSGNLDDACVDYLNNCAVGRGGKITTEGASKCLDNYLKGDRYKYEDENESHAGI